MHYPTEAQKKHADYDAFVEKFKPKKTTDDCYTPELVYNAIRDWVLAEYDIPENVRIIRPFYPGGDYQAEDYGGDCVVIDNPPFSILAQIKRWYAEHGVRYFLFAPALTLFSTNCGENYVICGASITYENGAKVNTSFVTNMGDDKIFVSHELREIIDRANAENLSATVKIMPVYDYPDHVVTAARLNFIATHGVSLRIVAKDLFFIRSMDAQRPMKKALFGSGYLLSEKAAAEKAAAEKAAAEKWELSDREWEIIKNLG